ncbi:hypothetical protein P3T37_005871 [Kitasatospora sp. MAA4]|uniref:hypothetical protein n=1 Tax=Kitasatospora sp. MAA4 TaxID=3035093 RepID=UPI002473964F|nr:hypothetical protein [Kitasatospora sp. MAA4]MDH6136443.1 hypothetical protein [Kitasatospora sp. MAA4]
MRVHRNAHVRNFTVLPNGLLQARQLSYTARGLLADLLSRPDGWREDGRHMADSSPQGRGAIRKALKELTEAGYYRVEIIRMPDGTVRSEARVYDTPQLAIPSVPRPVSGQATPGTAGAPLVKNRHQEPSLPADLADQPPTSEPATEAPVRREGGHDLVHQPSAMPDKQIREAVAALFRVIRAEPRLRIGEAEAAELAPLVAQWLERGSTTGDLAHALLPGLPWPLHSPVGLLRSRLERKMPPAHAPEQPSAARYAECTRCHDPVPQPGICRACAGLDTRQIKVGGGGAEATRDGAGRARAALRAAKSAVGRGRLAAIGG